jgi:hypothetical protein
LLDAMADRFLEDFGADLPAGSWDEQLSAAGWRLRQVLLSHRDGAGVMAGTYVAEPNTGRGVWEPKLTVDGIENKLAATAFTADPAERFGYGLQLFLDGIRQQLALLPSR